MSRPDPIPTPSQLGRWGVRDAQFDGQQYQAEAQGGLHVGVTIFTVASSCTGVPDLNGRTYVFA